jgi:hypothetical protein
MPRASFTATSSPPIFLSPRTKVKTASFANAAMDAVR